MIQDMITYVIESKRDMIRNGNLSPSSMEALGCPRDVAHDSGCRKVMELTGCKKPVKCSPLQIEPCERDNLGCWDVEAAVCRLL